MIMDKNRDSRRNSVSVTNGLPRRRQRVTSNRDSTEVEAMEEVRFRDRDREFTKRRRVDSRVKEITDSSDEEEEEDETSRPLTNKIRGGGGGGGGGGGLRTLRSSPLLRGGVDEVIGVTVPRRARSASAKKLDGYRNSVNGGFLDDLNRRKIGDVSSFGASSKKKMKYVEARSVVTSSGSNSKRSSTNQDDIEIEVAEALFDLMKQSQSQSQSQSDDDDEVKRLKAERGKDEIKVESEQSVKVNGGTNLGESMKKREKFVDDDPLVHEDVFVDKRKVGSPKSPSCVKVNACDIQDLTVTKADYASSSAVATKKVARMEIDLMALPSLPSSPERDVVLDIDRKVMTQDFPKKSESTLKDVSLAGRSRMQDVKNEAINSNNQLLNLDLEKNKHQTSSVNGGCTSQQEGRKEHKNQSPTSLLPFSIGTSSRTGVFSHPGFMPSQGAALPTDGSASSSMTMKRQQFKPSQPRRKRCLTHQYIAQNIHHHQKLITESLSSGPTGAPTLFGSGLLNLKLLPAQSSVPGKDKRSYVAAADLTSNKSMLQQASNQAPSRNSMHGSPGFIFPLGHHQTTMMAPVISSGPPHSTSSVGTNISLPSNASRKLSVNSTLPGPSNSTPVTFNHLMLPSNETAHYMAILQNSACPFPIPTNISLPAFKGGSSSTLPFLNSSFYPSPVFNVAQNHFQSASQKMSDNKLPASVNADLTQPDKENSPSVVDNLASHSVKPNNINNAQASSYSLQPINFGSVGNKHGDQSRPFLTAPVLNFSSMAQNSAIFQMLPEISWRGNKNFPTPEGKSSSHKSDGANAPSKFDNLGRTISFHPSSAPIPNFYPHMQMKGAAQPMSSTPNNHVFGQASVQTEYSPFFPKWDNLPRNIAAEGSSSQSATSKNHITFGHGVISGQPSSSLVVGPSSISSKNGPSQETEASQNVPGQKASPACRRNVPSILSACSSQLPELKYS